MKTSAPPPVGTRVTILVGCLKGLTGVVTDHVDLGDPKPGDAISGPSCRVRLDRPAQIGPGPPFTRMIGLWGWEVSPQT